MAVQTLILKLLGIKQITQASNKNLRNIIDTVHECLSQLNAYVSTKNWDPLIIFLVVDKLDNDTRKDWERLRHTLTHTTDHDATGQDESMDENASMASEAAGGSSKLPTWKQMEEFLDTQTKILRDIALLTAPTDARNQGQNSGRPSPKNASTNQTQSQRTSSGVDPCLLCRERHPIFTCKTWRENMSVDDRETFQRSNNLCKMCLQKKHDGKPCWNKPNWAKPCPSCLDLNTNLRWHNGTLCRRKEAKRIAVAYRAERQAQSTSTQQTQAPNNNGQPTRPKTEV